MSFDGYWEQREDSWGREEDERKKKMADEAIEKKRVEAERKKLTKFWCLRNDEKQFYTGMSIDSFSAEFEDCMRFVSETQLISHFMGQVNKVVAKSGLPTSVTFDDYEKNGYWIKYIDID
jgi:hypothetical protein